MAKPLFIDVALSIIHKKKTDWETIKQDLELALRQDDRAKIKEYLLKAYDDGIYLVRVALGTYFASRGFLKTVLDLATMGTMTIITTITGWLTGYDYQLSQIKYQLETLDRMKNRLKGTSPNELTRNTVRAYVRALKNGVKGLIDQIKTLPEVDPVGVVLNSTVETVKDIGNLFLTTVERIIEDLPRAISWFLIILGAGAGLYVLSWLKEFLPKPKREV